MRPEVIAPQPSRRFNGLRFNGWWLSAPEHSPVQISKGATQPKDLRSTFSGPLPFPTVQFCLDLRQEGSKAFKGCKGLRRQLYGSGRKNTGLFRGQIDDPVERILDVRLDLSNVV